MGEPITLENCGIRLTVSSPAEADWYMRAGYKKVESTVVVEKNGEAGEEPKKRGRRPAEEKEGE